MSFSAQGLLDLAGRQMAARALDPGVTGGFEFKVVDDVLSGSATVNGVIVTVEVVADPLGLLGFVAEGLNAASPTVSPVVSGGGLQGTPPEALHGPQTASQPVSGGDPQGTPPEALHGPQAASQGGSRGGRGRNQAKPAANRMVAAPEPAEDDF